MIKGWGLYHSVHPGATGNHFFFNTAVALSVGYFQPIYFMRTCILVSSLYFLADVWLASAMMHTCTTFGLCFFPPGVFFHSRVTGGCPVTTDLTMRFDVRNNKNITSELAPNTRDRSIQTACDRELRRKRPPHNERVFILFLSKTYV